VQRVNFYFLRKKVLARRRQREPAVEIIVTIAATRARPREQRRHWRAAILDRGRPVRVAASPVADSPVFDGNNNIFIRTTPATGSPTTTATAQPHEYKKIAGRK